MLLKTFLLTLVFQNGVLSASLHHSQPSENDILKVVEDELLDLGLVKANRYDKLSNKKRRQLGSWLSENIFSSDDKVEEVTTEVPATTTTTSTTEATQYNLTLPRVTFEEMLVYLRDGYDKFQRVVNDKEFMDFLSELYNKDYDGWIDLINSESVQYWFKSLFEKVEGALVNHILSNTYLSPVRSALNVLSPIYGGDPTHAVVSKVVSGILHG